MATLPPDEQETAWYEYASGYRTLPTLTLSLSAKLNTIPAGFCIKGLLPDTVTAIASQAYLSVVTDFKLSPSLDDIAVDAFVKGSTFVVEAGSYAELWCGENGFGYTLEGQDSLDWLNN
ncbi:MAG: hypothetical protein PHI27_07650 [Eubacteriales bacterium]|nr:hypothetical protein [Eubacteriales bacterium]MDD3882110.1 hypothetical protein [Eubacteriales bacterium]MDD4513215.1 hypothetical protein [Eubacteriales bacterium]